MRISRPSFGPCLRTIAFAGAVALFAAAAHAAVLEPQLASPLTTPLESLTGVSFAAGDGIDVLTAHVKALALAGKDI